MDYRAESELGALTADLLRDLERFRPGLPEEAGPSEAQQAITGRAHLRLSELYSERCEALGDALGPYRGAETQLDLYRREIDQIFLPRYTHLALRHNTEERTPRGPDAFNRGAYGLMFFLIGIFVVWAPFIPIWDKWVPFLMAVLAAGFSPALPDLRRLLLRRRYDVQLLALLTDIDEAGRALPAPPEVPALPAPPGEEKGVQ